LSRVTALEADGMIAGGYLNAPLLRYRRNAPPREFHIAVVNP
jgi:hypothetical protein